MQQSRIHLAVVILVAAIFIGEFSRTEMSTSASHAPVCQVWVTTTSPYVNVIDTIDETVSSLPSNGVDGTGPAQNSVAIDRTGSKLYVGLYNLNPLLATIKVFDASTYQLLTTIAKEGVALAASPTDDIIFAADYTDDLVVAIDTNSDSAGPDISTATDPVDLVVSPDGDFVYVSNSNDVPASISRIKVSDRSVITKDVETGPGAGPIDNPIGLAISADGEHLFVAGASTDNILRIQTDDFDVPLLDLNNFVAIGDQPFSLALTNDGTKLLVTSSVNGFVYVVDPATLALISSIPVGLFPYDVVISPDDRYAFVSNLTSNTVSQIRLSDYSVVNTYSVENGPGSMAIGPPGCVTERSSHGNRSPRRTVSLDPNGGTCLDGQSHRDEWTISFRGSRTIPGPDECTREGFVFGGWANTDTPDVVRELPIVDDSATGMRRYQISRDSSLIAIWHALPARPTDFLAASRLFCTSCNDVWLVWTTPPDGSSVTIVDDSGNEVCATGFLSGGDWNLCVLTFPDQRARTFSLTTKNQYGSSAPLTATVSFDP